MGEMAARRPGRPAAASRQDAVSLARRRFLAGERIDVQAIARELGLARATMHRWFGTREQLIGEVVADLGVRRLRALRAGIPGQGAGALLAGFDAFNREVATAPGLRSLIAHEQELALRILTAGNGLVQPRLIATVRELIEAELLDPDFAPAADPDVLAYAIVRLAEAFLYNDAVIGLRGDTERLRQLEAALLGLGRQAARS
jgi:AcrR family transcriptional regulator